MLGTNIDLCNYIKSLRFAGGIVECSIVIAAVKGIVSHKKPAQLKDHGGPLDLGQSWAESFLNCTGVKQQRLLTSFQNILPKLN